MRKTKGFTLVELVIVIVIVGILSIVAVPIYRGYTRKAMASEGKSLLGSIQTSEKIYFAEYGGFRAISGATAYDPTLDVDARANKYFSTYTVATSGAGYTAATTGFGGASGIALGLTGSSVGQTTTSESGI
jgi:prepilin-type N-terminal cleavage/methylation domain-containing protein